MLADVYACQINKRLYNSNQFDRSRKYYERDWNVNKDQNIQYILQFKKLAVTLRMLIVPYNASSVSSST